VKVEAWLFIVVAAFFAVTTAVYRWFTDDPAGTTALLVSMLMSGLIAVFLIVQRRKRGDRPEDRKDGEVRERAGPLDFFSPRSAYPVITAVGFTAAALGVVYGLWLFLIGVGVVGCGVFGFVFQHLDR
jgi:Cytochrome c oxidase subunit IV